MNPYYLQILILILVISFGVILGNMFYSILAKLFSWVWALFRRKK
jgi:Trk-type K+ transport system membrane component